MNKNTQEILLLRVSTRILSEFLKQNTNPPKEYDVNLDTVHNTPEVNTHV